MIPLPTRKAVRGHVPRGPLKTAVKPILKSLRSLSLAAQIDVRPCFTFNSIGQKTAIRWRDASDPPPVHCAAPRSARSLPCDPFGRSACLPAPSIRADLYLGARGKGRSLELSAYSLTRNCHYLSRAGKLNAIAALALFPPLRAFSSPRYLLSFEAITLSRR